MNKKSKRPPRTFRAENPNAVDVHVGSRVRLRRTLLGMSQAELGDAIGLTFQQVQKYERGTNRISASRLYHMARVFDVSVSHFFEELGESSGPGVIGEHTNEPVKSNLMLKRETLELVRAFLRITDPRIQRHFFEFAKAIAYAFDAEPPSS